MAGSRVLRAMLKLARRLRLTEAIRVASSHLPKRMEAGIRGLRARLRARSGEMDELIAEQDPLVPETELERSYRSSLRLLAERLGPDRVGDYLEFGVFTATSLACMHRASVEERLEHIRLFGFDSFEGLPESATTDDTARYGIWSAGSFDAPIALAWEALRSRGVDLERVTLVKGWFEDTLTDGLLAENDLRKAGVIMIDCDLYSSARTALAFCAPLIRDAAVILLDEWYPETMGADNAGERRAFDEFLAANPSLSATELESYAPEAKVFLVSRVEQRHGSEEQPAHEHGVRAP